ncbi:hypothetical protein [Bacillus sp. FJAT-29814]|uniref:hypothetical protein n=1 Tax=Bacillus sp. FJAT-29814 TaxID=1729688 RepID=UPI00082D92F4|nr:hypothetical protein [Bacillus sp. FJAT-29814]
MITENTLKTMQSVYGLIYEIENLLRQYVKRRMTESYGVNWFHAAPRIVLKRPPSKTFDCLHFYKYESHYLRTYSKAFEALPDEFYRQLRLFYPLRNKIAHCQDLNELELKEIYSAHSFIVNSLKNAI